MKIISQLLALIVAVAALSGCIDQDEGKMQGNKAASEVTK
jgi:outer membrane murein-binding lipoprotein Lpp